MSKDYVVSLATEGYSGPNVYLTTTAEWTGLEVGHEQNGESMTLERIGYIAEWAARAWENLSGEQYKPVYISERGYAADAGRITVSEPWPPPPVVDEEAFESVDRTRGGLFKGLRFPSQKGRDKA